MTLVYKNFLSKFSSAVRDLDVSEEYLHINFLFVQRMLGNLLLYFSLVVILMK